MSKLYMVTWAVLETDDEGSALDMITVTGLPSATHALVLGHQYLGKLLHQLRTRLWVTAPLDIKWLQTLGLHTDLSGNYVSRAIVQRYSDDSDVFDTTWNLTAWWTPLDDVSSASRQHFIDTGRYLRVGNDNGGIK